MVSRNSLKQYSKCDCIETIHCLMNYPTKSEPQMNYNEETTINIDYHRTLDIS